MADESLAAYLAEIKANPGKWYVYLLWRPSGTPFYVGLSRSIRGRQTRLADHLARARKGQRSHKASIIRQIEAAGLSVVCTIDSWHFSLDAAAKCEQELIAKWGRGSGKLANASGGGEGFVDPSPYHRKIMSDRMRQHHQNEAFAIKRNAIISAANADPATHIRTDRAIRRSRKVYEKAMSNLAMLNGDPERIAAATERVRRFNADPAYRLGFEERRLEAIQRHAEELRQLKARCMSMLSELAVPAIDRALPTTRKVKHWRRFLMELEEMAVAR